MCIAVDRRVSATFLSQNILMHFQILLISLAVATRTGTVAILNVETYLC